MARQAALGGWDIPALPVPHDEPAWEGKQGRDLSVYGSASLTLQKRRQTPQDLLPAAVQVQCGHRQVSHDEAIR
jgi:hypothetical protein